MAKLMSDTAAFTSAARDQINTVTFKLYLFVLIRHPVHIFGL